MLTIVFLISLLATTLVSSEQQLCNETDIIKTVDIRKGTHLSDDAVYFEGERYDKTEYFVDDNGVERGCVCLKKLCVQKCCPFGYGYSNKERKCVNTTAVFDPPVWDDYHVLEGWKATENFNFVFGKIMCKPDQARVRVGQDPDIKFQLRTDGKLFINVWDGSSPWTVHGPDSYCIDTFVSEGPEPGQITSKLDALICFSETKSDNHDYIMSSTCMIVSCVFLLATLAVYAWLPELRNLHGKVLMVYLTCLLVGFACFAAMQIMFVYDNILPTTCLTLSLVIYFSLESAFFWLNVMSFDIWWTFSGKRGPSSKFSTRARFIAYSAYAFGMSTTLTVLVITLEFSGLPPYPWLPLLRQGACFFYGKSKLIYFYGPIMILCVANILFFILTVLKITQIQRQTSVLKSKESSTHDRHRNDKQRLLLYMKLFTVMGVNWILEVISAVYPQIEGFWKYTDAYNVLIGLIIFIIFVCKRKIFRLIKKRIKERFHQPQSDIGEMTDMRHRNTSHWPNPLQRASQETIRTSVCDNESIMNGVITH